MNNQIVETQLTNLSNCVENGKNVMDFINSVKGNYYVISPYHKVKKKLPFTIWGGSTFGEYPVSVSTVEYKGWERHAVETNYSIESIKEMIEKGIIKPYTK